MDTPVIRSLPSALRDQIAAGEVVERPGSVVKELVENSIDARARTVRVEIDGGGLQRILIVDDGHGMDRAGARLALERHATSKLFEFDDLYRLETFGFRGEALPSIAAVSRLRLTTRRQDDLAGVELVVAAGEPPTIREIGAPVGTAVEVRDLFYNVPARRKFLKSVGTESGHVSDVCLDLALGRPDVALTLVRDGRVVRQYLRSSDRLTRARDIIVRAMGDAEYELASLSVSRARVRVEALVSPPERARSGPASLHLLVNGRPVRDRLLARAVAMAYGSVLDPGRYPIGVVYVDVPPEDVDVNVHPQKAEVRFARGRELYDDVTRALGAGLAGVFRGPLGLALGSSSDSGAHAPAADADVHPSVAALSSAMASAQSPGGFRGRISEEADPWGLTSPPVRPVSGDLFDPQRFVPETREDPPTAGHAAVSRGGTPYAALRFLAQVRATYLLCEGPDAIYVIDQHAAAERVNFARFRAAYARREVVRQQLLVPEIVAVESDQSAIVDDARDAILAFGIDARAIGDGRVAIHGVPALLAKAPPASLLRDLLGELGRTGDRAFGDAADLVLATMACHASVRAGDLLHPDECVALLESLDAIDFAGYCPHGRPILASMSYGDLEKKVGRR